MGSPLTDNLAHSLGQFAIEAVMSLSSHDPKATVSRLVNLHNSARSRACLCALGSMLAAFASGCLAPHYSVDERGAFDGNSAGSSALGASGGRATADNAGGGGAGTVAASGGGAGTVAASSGGNLPFGTGGAGLLNLHYCDPTPIVTPDASAAPDWSCVTSTRNNSTDTSGVVVTGRFLPMSGNTIFDTLAYCPISLAACDDTHSSLPDFSFTSSQQGCAIIDWHEGLTAYSATMWHTITRTTALFIGTIPLVNSTVVRTLASALQLPITADGAALIGIKDCSGNTASGVTFAAQSTAAGPAIGLHFSIQGDFSIPETTPTGISGFGGLANLNPGALTVYGYVGDGCIVAEARIASESSRVAYVYLVPNGYR